MKKLIIVLLIILISIPVIYLLWPLKSDAFQISWDNEALNQKSEYLAAIPKAAPDDSLPNILFILVDDLGLYDMSFYGGNKLQTPHMDNIAQSGIAFKQAYVASPMCSASRAGILTGRYPQRFGFEFQMHDRYLRNRMEYYGFKYFMGSDLWKPRLMNEVPRQEDIDKQGLPPSEISIADMLKARGYSTAIIGKWHTGAHEQNLPNNFGFDYQYGFFDAHTLYAQIGTDGIIDQEIPDDFTDQYNWKLGRSGTRGIFRNYQRIDEKAHLTDAITRESIAYMKAHRSGPFFLMASYNAPHTPLQAPDHYVEMFKHEPEPAKRVYYAMIKQLDDAIGRLLSSLTTLGIEEQTLVIFLSDNGGATYTYTTDNGPLKGGKITDFEGGIHVPFFMRWQNNLPAGKTYQAPVMGMDIYATLAAITNTPLPTDRLIDGKNLMAYIKSDSLIPHEHLYWQRGNSKALRSGNQKIIWNEEFQDTMYFDLSNDPYEEHNQYVGPKAIDLIELHEAWSETLPSPLWPSIVYFREKLDNRWVYFEN